MRAFTELFERVDQTTSTKAKVEAMAEYFRKAPPRDAAWGLFFLTGRRFKRLFPGASLGAWMIEATGLPVWLFEECYATVGDMAETIALLLESSDRRGETELALHSWVEDRILPLAELTEDEQRRRIFAYWSELSGTSLFLFNKLLTGGFRVGVSQTLVIRALAQAAGLEATQVAHRLMGEWNPSAEFFSSLVSPDLRANVPSQPYPFYLASPLDRDFAELGESADWLAEWKWDGIRAQILRRGGETFIWSRGEDLITDRFPELAAGAAALPDGTVLDGELLAFREGRPLPFAILQQRIGRKKLNPKVLSEAPVAFLAFDLIEFAGEDWRKRPLRERRAKLGEVVASLGSPYRISSEVGGDWERLAEERKGARKRGVEGLMLKRWSSPYGVGRPKGDWWKWKIDPFTVDAVLIYAQAGHGRRANLYTDYTFAVWKGEELVPIAKAYSGLSDLEIDELDRWIRAHTREKFGPVRSVNPELVFELAFEGIQASSRHKSGIALRFPRIHRWRRDKPAAEAERIENLQALLGEGIFPSH